MQRRSKVDKNQAEIVARLRAHGCQVLHLHQLKNCCDLLVGHNGNLYLFEIKDGSKPKSQRKLTEGEAQFFKDWMGYELHVVESIEDCNRILKLK